MDNPKEPPAAEEARWAALGRYVRALRGHRGWSQPDLEQASGVSVPSIRAIENHREGRRHTPRTLRMLSEGFGLESNYLDEYRKNWSGEEPDSEPEAVEAVRSLRSGLDVVVQLLDEIFVGRLEEIVIPRLEAIERDMRQIVDVVYNTGREAKTGDEHPGDAE
jgi:transcriptional regulator with XRE-family HTH domain